MYNLSAIVVCETWSVPSVSSSFVAIDGLRIVRGDDSRSIRKYGCCLGIGCLWFRLMLTCLLLQEYCCWNGCVYFSSVQTFFKFSSPG